MGDITRIGAAALAAGATIPLLGMHVCGADVDGVGEKELFALFDPAAVKKRAKALER